MRRLLPLLTTVALLASSCTMRGWGSQDFGQAGSPSGEPAEIGENNLDVAAGYFHWCELRADRSVWCGGDNAWGQLGTGDTNERIGRIRIDQANDWRLIEGGGVHNCGIRLDASLWCWGGYPHHEQSPDGSTITPSVPVEVAPGTTWTSVAPGISHTCGVQTDNSLWCWGLNRWGEIGDGTTNVAETPTEVSGGPWLEVAAGVFNTCAIHLDDSLWCWGEQVLDGFPTSQSLVPVRVATGTQWESIAGHETHFCGLQQDRSLWCWGWNHHGEVGIGSIDNWVRTPTQVGTSTDWRRVDVGMGHSCATQLDWSLWCWGRNNEGQLGDGGTTNMTSPVLIDDSASWLDIELGGRSTTGITVP